MNTDALSRAFVTSFPDPDTEFTPDELSIVVATYFGKPLPHLAGSTGKPIRDKHGKHVTSNGRANGTPLYCDAFGSTLYRARLDNAWTVAHDWFKHTIAYDLRDAGWHCELEVYGLFHDVLNGAQRAQFNGLSLRDRQGAVPDIHATPPPGFASAYDGGPLHELKGVRFGPNTYPAADKGVAALERAIPRISLTRLRKLDRQLFAHDDPTSDGPLVARYKSLGRSPNGVSPLAFGAFGEASTGVHSLLRAVAETMAPDVRDRYLCANEQVALATAQRELRQRWGAAIWHGYARGLLTRTRFVIDGWPDARSRRQHADREFHARRSARFQFRGRSWSHRHSAHGGVPAA